MGKNVAIRFNFVPGRPSNARKCHREYEKANKSTIWVLGGQPIGTNVHLPTTPAPQFITLHDRTTMTGPGVSAVKTHGE